MRSLRRAFDRGAAGPWVIVGLGNPGERYARTRHNAGAMTLAVLLERAGGRLKSHKSGCLVADVSIGGVRAVLARPTSYMNESGRPVGALAGWYKTPPGSLVVLHDELDLPFGEVRIKQGGGTAGHNGLRSLASHLGTKDFTRVRIGISRPRGDSVDYVLGEFTGSERKQLAGVLAAAADAVEAILADGVERAMTEVNART